MLGSNSFESENNVNQHVNVFYSFARPHSSLNALTLNQVTIFKLTDRKKKKYLLVA